MITDLVLLTNTTITAQCMVGWAQLVIKKVEAGYIVTLRANANGRELGPIRKPIKRGASHLGKIGVVGPLLKEGLEHLAVKSSQLPDGLPVEIVVGEKGETFKTEIKIPLDLGVLDRLSVLLGGIEAVNKVVKR